MGALSHTNRFQAVFTLVDNATYATLKSITEDRQTTISDAVRKMILHYIAEYRIEHGLTPNPADLIPPPVPLKGLPRATNKPEQPKPTPTPRQTGLPRAPINSPTSSTPLDKLPKP